MGLVMRRHAIRAVLVGVIATCALAPARAAEPNSLADEQFLRSAGLGTDGPKLLEFFRKRTAQTADPDVVRKLVAQLSDKVPEKREQAVAELIAIGVPAVPELRAA